MGGGDRAVHVEAVKPSDRDVIACLLVELYAHEVPGMLHGTQSAQVAFARRMVDRTPPGSRLALYSDGSVVGMGSVATVEEPRPSTPAGVVLAAPFVVGPVHGLRTIMGGVRGLLSVEGPPRADEAQIHSLVVSRLHRGRGLGAYLLARLEEEALARQKTRAVLQVVRSNESAIHFYRSHGYRVLADNAAVSQRRLGYSTVRVGKDL